MVWRALQTSLRDFLYPGQWFPDLAGRKGLGEPINVPDPPLFLLSYLIISVLKII